MVKKAIYSISFFGIFVIKFLPLTLPLLMIMVVKMIITADEIEKNEEGNRNTKTFFVISIYLLVFLLIFFYLKRNNLSFGDFQLF